MNSDKRIKITFENFAKTNEEILSSNKKYIGVFKGRIDQTTGVNWCSDCVAAEEPIRKYLIPIAEKKNITVVEISVGTREE